MRALLLAGAALVGMAGAAQADVVLTITTTGGQQPGGMATVNGTITLTDAAFASGFQINRPFNAGMQGYVPPDFAALGLVDIALTASGFGGFQAITIAELLRNASTVTGGSYSFGLRPNSNGLTGNLYFLNQVNVVSLTFAGDAFTGYARSDTPGRECEFGLQPGSLCTFSGTVTATPVPEPATLALFGVGLFGLAAVRRRG